MHISYIIQGEGKSLSILIKFLTIGQNNRVQNVPDFFHSELLPSNSLDDSVLLHLEFFKVDRYRLAHPFLRVILSSLSLLLGATIDECKVKHSLWEEKFVLVFLRITFQENVSVLQATDFQVEIYFTLLLICLMLVF